MECSPVVRNFTNYSIQKITYTKSHEKHKELDRNLYDFSVPMDYDRFCTETISPRFCMVTTPPLILAQTNYIRLYPFYIRKFILDHLSRRAYPPRFQYHHSIMSATHIFPCACVIVMRNVTVFVARKNNIALPCLHQPCGAYSMRLGESSRALIKMKFSNSCTSHLMPCVRAISAKSANISLHVYGRLPTYSMRRVKKK